MSFSITAVRPFAEITPAVNAVPFIFKPANISGTGLIGDPYIVSGQRTLEGGGPVDATVTCSRNLQIAMTIGPISQFTFTVTTGSTKAELNAGDLRQLRASICKTIDAMKPQIRAMQAAKTEWNSVEAALYKSYQAYKGLVVAIDAQLKYLKTQPAT